MNGTSTISSSTAGFTISAALAIAVNTLLTIAKELSQPLHDTMQAALGHHWITQSVVIVLIFILFGWLFSRWSVIRGRSGTFLAMILGFTSIVSGVGLLGFFLVV